MSKELTPLEAFGNVMKSTHLTYLFTYYEKELDIIEKALKRLEINDTVKKQIENLPPPQLIKNNDGSFEFEGEDCFVLVPKKEYKKQLKALEIIKKYIPYYIEIETDENGKIIMSDHEHLVQDELAKEEYDLLKEVLL